jgi:hypothetical protein
MKIPESVKIGGHLYQIKTDSQLQNDRGREGETSPHRLIINIDASGAPTHIEEALIHEIVENWNHRCELGLPHDKITTLGFLLHQFITDNPEMFENEEK